MEIKHSTFVRASPEKVYEALTTSRGLDGWFTKGGRVDPRAGGKILFRWRGWGPERNVNADEGGPVLEAIRPKRFVFQWRPDKPSYYTTVEVNFDKVEDGTIIRLREYGYRNTLSGRRQMLDCASGWGEALTLLKFYVEHGTRY